MGAIMHNYNPFLFFFYQLSPLSSICGHNSLNYQNMASADSIVSSLASVASTTKLGRSFLMGVAVGQDSSSFNRKKGLSYEFFYPGEIVSMVRSDGRRTIGQILTISAVGALVDMGDGARKDIPAAEIPQVVSKLMGLFYLSA
jgi:hypothetical protein